MSNDMREDSNAINNLKKNNHTVKNKSVNIELCVHQALIDNYDRYFRLAYSYVRNETDAMDIVQEGAYRAILKCGSIRQKEFVETWIYRVMIRTALNFLKKKKQEQDFSELSDIVEGTEDHYENVDLKNAIRQLGEPAGTIIRLRFFEELPISQIAEILKENENTIKSRLYRSLKSLKKIMERED